jgi:hypothetical protein
VGNLQQSGRRLLPGVAMIGGLALINAVIWLLLPQPPEWGCGDKPPGQDAKLHDFRVPSYILIAVLGAAVAAWLLWSSVQDRGDRPGTPTIVAAALPALLGIASLFSPGAREVWVLPGLLGLAALFVALPLLALWGILLLVQRPRERAPVWYGRTIGWTVLYLGLPATGLFVWLQGSGFTIGC